MKFGNSGLEQLSYDGVVLEDLAANSGDAFHIGHMKCTDLSGKVVSTGQYGWGESNAGRSWDAAAHTWTYHFVWGSIQTQFVQSANALDMKVTSTNLSDSGVIFDGAVIYPLVLHFPKLPQGFTNHSYEQLAFNTTGPSVTAADYGAGEVISAVLSAAKPLYSGFEPTSGTGFAYTPILSGTGLDGMASFFPRNDRPVKPGETDSYTVSLRFAPSRTPPAALTADVYAAWHVTMPGQLNWADRRIIGTAYLATSPQGKMQTSFANNPRRYFNDGNPSHFDVRTPDGLPKFQSRMLQQAQAIAKNLQQLNAQGVITWDLEGEQFPQSTSYVCAPDEIAAVAPEMESIVSLPDSPYRGKKLDDAYFATIHDAGFRTGVCIRPQQFRLVGDKNAEQVNLPTERVEAELERKAKFAHSRWAVTIFYVDSSVNSYGAALDPEIFQKLAAALPDCLFIPEESSLKDYAYAAPFQSFLFHAETGTSKEVYEIYPKAFSANLVNDVAPAKLAQARARLTAAVSRGDVLMVHADYWQDNNATVVQIYKDAKRTSASK